MCVYVLNVDSSVLHANEMKRNETTVEQLNNFVAKDLSLSDQGAIIHTF